MGLQRRAGSLGGVRLIRRMVRRSVGSCFERGEIDWSDTFVGSMLELALRLLLTCQPRTEVCVCGRCR